MTWLLVVVLAFVALAGMGVAAWTIRLYHQAFLRNAELTDRLLSVAVAQQPAPVKASFARIERDRSPVEDVRAEAEAFAAQLNPDLMPVGMDAGII